MLLDPAFWADAGLDTCVLVLRTVPDDLLLVLPMLMPPRTVPPDVLRLFLPELLEEYAGLSVFARKP